MLNRNIVRLIFVILQIIEIIKKHEMMRIFCKYTFAVVFSFAAIGANAQDVWEAPSVDTAQKNVKEKSADQEKKLTVSKDSAYLAGAVIEMNGKVNWTLDIDLPGLTSQQIYDKVLNLMTEITKSENQLADSKVALVNKKEHVIVTTVREWLIFKNQFLSLDRTKFFYTLIARCSDGKLSVSMERLSYLYDENNGKGEQKMLAEDVITDRNALNKKQTKLIPGWAKFRRKTIDRKNELFNEIRDEMKK